MENPCSWALAHNQLSGGTVGRRRLLRQIRDTEIPCAKPAQRALIRRFTARLCDLFAAAAPIGSVLEVGIGEGFLSGYLSERFPHLRFLGVDPSHDHLARLRPKFSHIEAIQGTAYDLSAFMGRDCDVVLCCEVLGHLRDPMRALSEIERLGPRRALFSVPNEPLFRLANLARAKNVARLGSDPEHIHHFNRRELERLLARHFDVLRVVTSFPWTMALAARRKVVRKGASGTPGLRSPTSG